MKKALLIIGIIAGALLLLCCGGGVALYFLADTTTYAKPADACATVAGVDGIGTKAFAMYTTAGGALMYELDFYDGNLYVSLNLTAPTGTTLTPDKVRADFLVIGKSLMSSLESTSSGSDWDD